MLETLLQADKELFLLLNSKHQNWLDPVMFYVSKTWTWVPLYLYLIWILYRSFGKKIWLPLLAIGITLTLADRISSGFIKPTAERPRPCHEETLKGQVFTYEGKCGGRFGFVSSHAANTFAVAFLFIFLFSGRNKWFYLLLIWPILVSYSRIYLGVHYPGDIFGGAILGIFLALIAFLIIKRVLKLNKFV